MLWGVRYFNTAVDMYIERYNEDFLLFHISECHTTISKFLNSLCFPSLFAMFPVKWGLCL